MRPDPICVCGDPVEQGGDLCGKCAPKAGPNFWAYQMFRHNREILQLTRNMAKDIATIKSNLAPARPSEPTKRPATKRTPAKKATRSVASA